MLAQHFGQLTGVDARDAGNSLALQPVSQTLHSVPMAVLIAVIAHNDSFRMDFLTLHEGWQSIGFKGKRRHTVVTDQGISQRH